MKHNSPEINLLLSLFENVNFQNVLDQHTRSSKFRWEYLFELVKRNGLHGYIFTQFIESNQKYIPQEVYRKQKKLHKGSILKAMRMSYELYRVMNYLASSNIDAVTFKGATLAKKYYSDIHSRNYCDLDILVHPTAVKQTIKILSKIGYDYIESDFSAEDFDKHIKLRQECTLVHRENGIPIDLHWGFHKTIVTYIKDIEPLFERAVKVELMEGKVVTALSSIDLFFIESIHLFDDFSKKQFSLKLVTDYLKIMQTLTEEEWEIVLEMHRENKQLKKLYCWCELVRLLFAVEPPKEIMNKIGKNPKQKKLAAIIAREFFDESPNFNVKYLLLLSSLFDSPVDSLRFLLHLLLFSITDEDKFKANIFIKIIFKILNPIRALTIKMVK